jgi:hypothetical protein
MNIREFVNYVTTIEGGTFDVQWDSHGNIEFYQMELTTGYMVSTRDTLIRYSLTIDELWEWMEQNKDNLETYYLGSWKFEGMLFIDLTMNIGSRARAIELGDYHKQIAIYDNAKREVIVL